MPVVAFLGARSGVGKTTAAVAVASVWQSQGRKVFLVDCDPNGAAGAWASRVKAAGRPVPSVSGMWFGNEDQALLAARQCDVMIVDCPTGDEVIAGVVLGVANVAVIVCEPRTTNPDDLRDLMNAVSKAQDVRVDLTTSMDEDQAFGPLGARVLLNGRPEDGRISTTLRDVLSERDIITLPAELRRRPGLASLLAEGRTVGDLPPDDQGAYEARSLAGDLAALLHQDPLDDTDIHNAVEDTERESPGDRDFSTTEITARVMIGRIGDIQRRRSSPSKPARVRTGAPALAIELGEVSVDQGKLAAPVVVVFGKDIERVTLVPEGTNVPCRLLHTFSFDHRGETMRLALVAGDDAPPIGELTLVFTHKTGQVSGTIEYRVSAEGIVSIALTGNYAGIAEIVLPKR